MALSDVQIAEIWCAMPVLSSEPLEAIAFARAIEAEVRKQDEALIRQMLEALESADYNHAGVSAAITAARARLGTNPPPGPNVPKHEA
ncbi:hypothetical protein [Acidovorax sp. NB1]|uniref:hypothetical protein n=1 Tax=Acidovorax sp. NB1 TaxID=1943571 RepID=UPI0010ECBE86|nr:hypothetical protein [Acidovorax sp. NB1]GDY37280.1 hypothetical protein ACINB_31720 [Acidovorax sp. NB1]